MARKKMFKAGGNLSSIFYDLNKLFELEKEPSRDEKENDSTNSKNTKEKKNVVKCVVITIGPSIFNAKEQYVIRFPFSSSSSERQALIEQDLNRIQQEVSRRCIRELLRGTMSDEYSKMFSPSGANKKNVRPCRVHLTILMNQDMADSIYLGSLASLSHDTDNDTDYCKEDNSMSVSENAATSQHLFASNDNFHYCLSRNLIMRRKFRIRKPRGLLSKRKKKKPFVLFDVLSSYVDEHKNLQRSEMEDEEGIWMSLRTTLQGFRS